MGVCENVFMTGLDSTQKHLAILLLDSFLVFACLGMDSETELGKAWVGQHSGTTDKAPAL